MDNTPPPPHEHADSLAEAMIHEMRSQGVVGNIAHDDDNHRLINESIDPIDIGGLEQACASAPEEAHPDILRRYIASHLRGREELESWHEASQRVLPLLRPEVEQAN